MSRHIQLLISEEFAEKIIPENDCVRLCDDIIDEMNLYSLFHTYSDRGRKYAINPRTLLKILVYANMQGIYSSRDIETACKRNINFMWLLNGEKTPNHFEKARFRSKRLSQCKDEIFYQLVNKLAELKEIKFEHLYVDGTKIEANANKYSFVWKKSTNKYEIRLLEKLEKIHFELCIKYMVNCESAEELLKELNAKVRFPFVYGRGKRKTELQRDIEQLTDLLTRKKKYEKYQATYFENKNQKCYIKPQNYERSKTRNFKNNMALRENMEYDEKRDEYICQNGKKLQAVYVGTRKSKSGFESEITYYECENCEGCPYKKSCTRAKGNRKISLSKKFIKQRKHSLDNITSPMGILLRTNRSIQSEGAFGVIKENYKFRQFLLRGKEKVSTEITLLAIAYNINKYHHKIQDNRTGIQLHGKLSA